MATFDKRSIRVLSMLQKAPRRTLADSGDESLRAGRAAPDTVLDEGVGVLDIE
jgi:hypothetical protein